MRAFTKSLALVALVPVSLAIAAQDKLQEFHSLCAPQINTPLSSEIPCTKALLNASQDPVFNARDPATQLYVIGADKLLHNLAIKRISETDAREKLLRMMLDLEDRHRPELLAMQAQQEEQIAAAQHARQDAERNEELAEKHRQEEIAQEAQFELAQAQRQQAVKFCIDKVNERFKDLTEHGNSVQRGNAVMQWGGTNSRLLCGNDPNYYQSLPAVPVVTQCQGSNDGGFVNLTCENQ
jgi:hypothetical protein